MNLLEIIKIAVLGLIGINILVVIHELGHLLCARACGIHVEAFSLGRGLVLWRFKPKNTEYRISLLPLGGYCKLKGEEVLVKALETGQDIADTEEGSFYSAHPVKRILVALSGPFLNFIFAILVFVLLSTFPQYSNETDPKLVVDDTYAEYPAAKAGLKTGDWVISINGAPINYFSDLSKAVFNSDGKSLTFVVVRDGREIAIPVTPKWNENRYMVGVSNWVEPRVESIEKSSFFARAGMTAPFTIKEIEGQPVSYTAQIARILEKQPSVISMTVLETSGLATYKVVPDYTPEGYPDFSKATIKSVLVKSPGLPFPANIEKGFSDTFNQLGMFFTSFKYIPKTPLEQSIGGPIRVLYMTGQTVNYSFASGPYRGIMDSLNFLALISMILFIMNLLPIPPIDGGLIVFFLVELIRRKPLKAKTVYRFQAVGFFLMMGIFLLSFFSDFLYFFK
jgi:regulator of sigma E protease